MISGTWRGLLGGIIAGWLLSTAADAATTPSSTGSTSKAATAPSKSTRHAPAKIVRKPPAVHAGTRTGAVKAKRPVTTAAAARKPGPAKKTVPKKTVAIARNRVAAKPAAVAPRPAAPAVIATAAHGNAAAPSAVSAASVSLALTVDAPRSPDHAAPAATSPADPQGASAFVTHFLTDAFRIAKLSGATSLQRRAQLAELFADKIDVKRIAGYTTADELSGKSVDIQQRFRTILVSYLVETYYPQLELASGPGVRVDTAPVEPLADGTAVIWTTFTKDGWGSQSVKWHVAA
ncbi:MAG TPA: ABC transporter substrate-binding protein, partial [Stellaceae bacterium]|nr:ABC transporter substrate-binding protein [Stellaceae bacterium]